MHLITIEYRNETATDLHNSFVNKVAGLTTVEANTFENQILDILKAANQKEIDEGKDSERGQHQLTIKVTNIQCDFVIDGNPFNGAFSNSGEVVIPGLLYAEANEFENQLLSFLQGMNERENLSLLQNQMSPIAPASATRR